MSNHLKLRQSQLDPTRLINNRGDSVKFYTPTHASVNGNHQYTPKSISNAIGRLGKK